MDITFSDPSFLERNDDQGREEVKGRIFDAARQLFVHKGYKDTGVRDIAKAADTNIAMVNYYFGSKYQLFEQVFEQAFEVLWQRIFTTLTSGKEFFDVVRDWIDAYYDTLLQYPQLPVFILNEVNIDPDRLTQRFKKREPHSLFLRVSIRIEEEVRKGNIKSIPTLDLMLNIISLSVFPFIFRNLATPLAGVTPDQYDLMLAEHKEYVTSFVIDALRP